MTKEKEFYGIIKPLIDNSNFIDTKSIEHHGITRYEHCMNVAYYSYKITKFLRLNYKETTEAALLHDFFLDEVENENQIKKLRKHPEIAVKNAKKYFELTARQEDIIRTHMFPVTFTPPKYLESWIVDLVDDAVAIYERGKTTSNAFRTAVTFLFMMTISYMNFH